MFDPEDKKRAAVRRSLLDHVPVSKERSRHAASPRGAGSILNRLQEPDAALPEGKGTGPIPQQQVFDEPKTTSGRMTGWLSGRDRTSEPTVAVSQQPYDMQEERQDLKDRPLFDIATIVGSVWQVRTLIVVLTVLGAIGGALLALSTPSVYVAESKLYIDPREIRLTDSDLSKESLATEGILALVDSQLEVLRSRAVLEKVAVDMGLDRDAEFGGKAAAGGGLSAGLDVVRNLMSPAQEKPVPASGVNPKTLDTLSEAVTVARDPKTFIVTVQVKSRDPAKSALIANRIVATFLNEEQSAQSGFSQRTTAALDSRLAELRQQLDTAENAVEKYKAEHDISGASGQLISDKQLFALNDQVGAVRNRIADARSKAEVITKTNLNDVLSGAFPEEISSVTMQELRKQFSTARAQLSSLDANLGPRHPQRLAAAQALEVARSEIGNELRRIEARSQTELDRAVRAEQDLVQQLAVLKARQFNSSSGYIELRELERKANATRTIYESFLKRASETGQEEKLTSKNIRVVSSAEPPIQATGPSRKLIAIGGLFAGLMAGIGLGVALGIYRSLLDLLQGTGRAPATVRRNVVSYEDDDPIDPRPPRVVETKLPEPRAQQRERMPSAHHAAATSAAFSAASPHHDPRQAGFAGYPRDISAQDREADDIAKVQANLRALRSRVETYARLRTGTGR